jgi:uncharacterized protein YqkB
MNRKQAVFFEEKMRLDADPATYSFRLDSSGQNYGTNIQVLDARA